MAGPGAGGQETIQAAPTGGSVAGFGSTDFVAYGEDVDPEEQGVFAGSAGAYMPLPGSELSDSAFTYADPSAFTDPNAQNIYNVINYGLNNQSQRAAPRAAYTTLGQGAYAGQTQLAPGMMLSGAQIAPQMFVDAASLDTARDLQYAQAQNQVANLLAQQAQGYGPSVAEQQSRDQMDRAVLEHMAMLGSQRGASNAALGQRAAYDQAAAALQQAASTGALGRSQEAMSAQQQLASVLGGARGQGQATAQTQAQLAQQALLANQGVYAQAAQQQAQLNQQAALANQQSALGQAGQNATLYQQVALANAQAAQKQSDLTQQTNLANQQASLQQQQMNNQLYQQSLSAYLQQNQQDISNAVAYQQLLSQEQLGMLQVNSGHEIASQGTTSGLASAAMSAGGALLAMSDRRAKYGVRSAGREVMSFLDYIREL